MSFWYFFPRVLPSKPGRALAALYWHITRRRVRARNCLRTAAADLPFAYHLWIGSVEKKRDSADLSKDGLERLKHRPQFALLVYGRQGATEQHARKTLDSITRQVYPYWNVVLVGSCSESVPLNTSDQLSSRSANAEEPAEWPLARAIADADADFIVPVRIGDILSKMALFRMAEALQSDPSASVLYGDQDELDVDGLRRRPWFKPRWNREMFLAHDYLSAAVAIWTPCARIAVRNSQSKTLSGFLLSATDGAGARVVHIPHILVHLAPGTRSTPDDRLEAVARHLQPLGATCTAGAYGTIKVQWPLPRELPLVTIIVPTRDKVELLRPCIESVLTRTDYSNFELLIVDNDSVEQSTADYFQELASDRRVRVVRYPGPYNFSAMNNFALSHARGTHVCLLNNDTEVVEPIWLTEMMRYAVRPDVGAVGAKLLYPDGSIQHAGVVIGIGDVAGHVHRFLPANQPGYFKQPHVPQFVSAVTAACLVVEKRKFAQVGGFDEDLAVAFNDVDFCLKIEAAGWCNVYVPYAVLVHHESKTRGTDFSPDNIERYRLEVAMLQERWETPSYEDPLLNPNLDRHNETLVPRL
jgi:GT2 family glycosyltransferase